MSARCLCKPPCASDPDSFTSNEVWNAGKAMTRHQGGYGMFEQMILSEPRGRRRWTTLLALAGQVAVLGILLLIPFFSVQQLPLSALNSSLIAPPPPPPPAPPPAAAASTPRVAHAVVPRHFDTHTLFAPKVVPKTVAVLPNCRRLRPKRPRLQAWKAAWPAARSGSGGRSFGRSNRRRAFRRSSPRRHLLRLRPLPQLLKWSAWADKWRLPK